MTLLSLRSLSSWRVVRACALSVLCAATLTACASPSVDVLPPFAVVETNPSHGAVEVSPNAQPRVGFNQLVSTDQMEHGIHLVIEGTSGFVAVDAHVQVTDAGHVGVIIPVRPLDPKAHFQIRVDAAVQDTDGDVLGADLRSDFNTGAAL